MPLDRFATHNIALLVVLAAAALFGLAVFAFRWRVSVLHRREQELAALVESRTAELRANERELAARNAQLAELAEERSRFFTNLSHEFRTPLTLILGPLRSLLEGRHGPLSPSVREQSVLMERNAQRLLRLVNQVLDLSRLEAGAVALARQPGDFGAFVHATALAFAPLAERRRIALSVEGAREPMVVAFDAEHFEKVVLNLVSNALKFTEPGGRVAVSVSAEGGEAVLRVRDSGVGITPDALPRVFERFWQADASANRQHEGTGVGLALARELVTLHDSTITAESTPGSGSTFTVRLPLVSDPLMLARVLAGDGPVHTTPVPAEVSEQTHVETEPDADDITDGITDDRTTVLLVDDNADLRTFVRSLLTDRFRVLEAADGRAGLEQARALLPDLVVADVMMPELDGLALGRALRLDPMTDAIPLVLLTARATAADQVRALETGADAFLTKPFEPTVLVATVDSLLAQRRRLRDRFGAGEPTDEALAPNSAAPTEAPALASAIERRLRPLVEARLTDASLDHATLAEDAGLSYHQLYRALRDATGESPSRFIRRVRVERAAALLQARAGSVGEVAYSVGFESLSYFSRAFAERFGMSPSALLRGAGATTMAEDVSVADGP